MARKVVNGWDVFHGRDNYRMSTKQRAYDRLLKESSRRYRQLMHPQPPTTG